MFRLLTSKQYGRPENPPCSHAYPYPSFYLGVLGGRLGKKSWVDLQFTENLDAFKFREARKSGMMTFETQLKGPLLRDAMDCIARADDTTKNQDQATRDTLASLPPAR